jgi:glucans biosynthesis protein
MLIERARAMAARRYRPRPTVPQDWQDLSYDMYRQIWFRTADALWSGTDLPYEVDFFHPGLYFPRAVQIHTVADGQAQRIPFDYALFDHTDNVPELTQDDSMGFSGFRLRTELDQPGIRNEFCVFQGASYFRAIGHGQIYGLSARGLALKTGDPMGEEFPDFTDFYLETPEPGQRNIVVHALLDSPSVTGAYRFDILPGEDCVMEVEATLFARESLGHLGLAPLTSMFMFDETNRARFDDFRSAVHDSDGLMIANGAGEMLWRPLANPRNLQFSAFQDENPRGFGLMQRARRQSDFGDLEALYHRRPGLWVEPRGDWGRGSVLLVEIPTDKEIYDNIVAYWRPQGTYEQGARIDLAYRLTWGVRAPAEPVARAINTRIGGTGDGQPSQVIAIDFEAHPDFDGGPENLTRHLWASAGTVSEGILQHNPETGGLRLSFRFDPGEAPMVEFRAQLRRDEKLASEVWLYRWTA